MKSRKERRNAKAEALALRVLTATRMAHAEKVGARAVTHLDLRGARVQGPHLRKVFFYGTYLDWETD